MWSLMLKVESHITFNVLLIKVYHAIEKFHANMNLLPDYSDNILSRFD